MRFLMLPIILLATIAFAQKEPAEFGDVSMEELESKNYNDTAAAIVLFDKGNTIVEPNSTSGTTFKRHLRIKILKKAAFDEWGNVKVFGRKNGLSHVRGVCYNLENGVVQKSELTESSIFKIKTTKYREEINFAFPNVREGSVIELTYTETYEGLYLLPWEFQCTIPTRWSEYTLYSPVEGYVTHLRGSVKPTKYESKYQGKYQSWVMTNIPAFKTEPSMPDKDVYLSTIEFSAQFNSWLGIYGHLINRENFTGIIHKHHYLKAIVEEITAGFTDPRQKIMTISNYLKKEINWNGEFDLYGVDPKEVLEKRSGSVADINLLFGSMMEKAGLKVNMVLLSTRNHGYIMQEFPSLDQFNYVICEVTLPDGELLVDATEKYLPFDMLPQRCYNHKGFLIAADQYGWIGIEPMQREKTSMDADLTLTEEGNLKGKLNIIEAGYAAFNSRKIYFQDAIGKYKRDFAGNNLWTMQRNEIQNMNDPEKPVVENYDVAMDGYATRSADLIYFNPNIFLREELNPYVLPERHYPIDFETLTEKVVVCNIVLPDGYLVEELPESKASILPENGGKFTFNVSHSGNRIMVVSKVQINKTLFQPDEYLNLKEFYARLVAKKAENIILKKRKP